MSLALPTWNLSMRLAARWRCQDNWNKEDRGVGGYLAGKDAAEERGNDGGWDNGYSSSKTLEREQEERREKSGRGALDKSIVRIAPQPSILGVLLQCLAVLECSCLLSSKSAQHQTTPGGRTETE